MPIPSHDPFGRVIGALEPEELERSFLVWISEITTKLNIKVVHIDGKTTKGSYDRGENSLSALHRVSAWSSEHGLMLAQQQVSEQSNEITAVPLLLRMFT